MGAINTVDDFLKHRSSERTGGFLTGWRKNIGEGGKARINVWLHMRRLPLAIWQHNIPRIVVREDRKTGQSRKEIWSGNYICREDEAVLKTQYRRKDDGTRVNPPKACPLCRLIEVVRDMVEEEQLDWLAPIFRFEGDRDIQVIHAAGLYGGFEDTDDWGPEDFKAIKEAGLRLDETYKEKAYSACKYVFCVVDNANPGEGVRIAVEAHLLGDKVKDVINDALVDIGSEAGNPFIHPYCIQWEFDPDKRCEINKKYKARRMSSVEITPTIEALIKSDPPDLSPVAAPFNMASVRAMLEHHCLVELPWDFIFDVASTDADEAPAGEFPPKGATEDRSSVGMKTGEVLAADLQRGVSQPRGNPASGVEDEDMCPECKTIDCPHVACDQCAKPILPDDAKCKHCGKVYKEDPKLPPKGRKGGRGREFGDKVGA